jgi:uncharacterized membrane protein YphA (DoxX/SURF4 family)
MSTLWGNPIHFEAVDMPTSQRPGQPQAAPQQRTRMKTVYLIARIGLGVIFGLLGVNGFVPFLPIPPTIPPVAATFFGAMVVSHYSYFVFAAQVIAGLLVLFNRYVPLAIVTLAAVLANVWAFHITMWPAAIFPMPIIATVLWFTVAWSIRSSFAPLFAKKVEPV